MRAAAVQYTAATSVFVSRSITTATTLRCRVHHSRPLEFTLLQSCKYQYQYQYQRSFTFRSLFRRRDDSSTTKSTTTPTSSSSSAADPTTTTPPPTSKSGRPPNEPDIDPALEEKLDIIFRNRGWSTTPTNTGNPFFDYPEPDAKDTGKETPSGGRSSWFGFWNKAQDTQAKDSNTATAQGDGTNTASTVNGTEASQDLQLPTAQSPPQQDTKTNPTTNSSRNPPTTTTMSDADYASFLDSANADYSSPSTNSNNPKPQSYTTKTVDGPTSSVHTALTSVNEVYVSDSDESWQPVSLSLPAASAGGSGGELDASAIATLAGGGISEEDIEVMDVGDFDPKGRYSSVVSAVKEAVGADGGVKVFRVQRAGARCEYWVVGLAEGKGGNGKRFVGMWVAAVES